MPVKTCKALASRTKHGLRDALALLLGWLLVGLPVMAQSGENTEHRRGHERHAFVALSGTVQGGQALVSQLTLHLQSGRHVARKIFEYVYKVEIDNSAGEAAQDIELRLSNAGPGTSIIDGSVRVANLPGFTRWLADDTITIRHDRSFDFEPASLVWTYGLRRTTVQVDPLLPRHAFATVASIISPLGEGLPGDTIALPGLGEGVVLALDREDRIYLASVEIGPTTTLSADSTAIVLARMAFGATPVGMTGAEFNAALRSVDGYQGLVSDITAAIETGLLPLENPAVHQGIATVLARVRDQLPLATAAGSEGLMAMRVLTDPSLEIPSLVEENLAGYKLSLGVTQLAADDNVEIKNELPIAWSIGREGQTRKIISGNGLADVLLGRTPILNWFWGPATQCSQRNKPLA